MFVCLSKGQSWVKTFLLQTRVKTLRGNNGLISSQTWCRAVSVLLFPHIRTAAEQCWVSFSHIDWGSEVALSRCVTFTSCYTLWLLVMLTHFTILNQTRGTVMQQCQQKGLRSGRSRRHTQELCGERMAWNKQRLKRRRQAETISEWQTAVTAGRRAEEQRQSTFEKWKFAKLQLLL